MSLLLHPHLGAGVPTIELSLGLLLDFQLLASPLGDCTWAVSTSSVQFFSSQNVKHLVRFVYLRICLA